MSVPAARVADCRGDFDAFFELIARENAGSDRRFARQRASATGSPRRCRGFGVAKRLARRASIPIGNAAAALEPIGGEGMGLAMRSAELAAMEMLGGPRPRAVSAARSEAVATPPPLLPRGGRRDVAIRRPRGIAVRTISANDAVARGALKFVGK